jgi:hypothetical protein
MARNSTKEREMSEVTITVIKRTTQGWQGYLAQLETWAPLPWAATASANRVYADLDQRGLLDHDKTITVWE